MKQRKTNGETAVLVTTAHRGVFFGYATETDGETIALKRARLCLYWSRDVKGFMGLAANGPSKSCKIGPPADIDLRAILLRNDTASNVRVEPFDQIYIDQDPRSEIVANLPPAIRPPCAYLFGIRRAFR